jgi:hypothetical protein
MSSHMIDRKPSHAAHDLCQIAAFQETVLSTQHLRHDARDVAKSCIMTSTAVSNG